MARILSWPISVKKCPLLNKDIFGLNSKTAVHYQMKATFPQRIYVNSYFKVTFVGMNTTQLMCGHQMWWSSQMSPPKQNRNGLLAHVAAQFSPQLFQMWLIQRRMTRTSHFCKITSLVNTIWFQKTCFIVFISKPTLRAVYIYLAFRWYVLMLHMHGPNTSDW
jgi:hypothetical protein